VLLDNDSIEYIESACVDTIVVIVDESIDDDDVSCVTRLSTGVSLFIVDVSTSS
jgi:hypothetical protein